MEESYIPITERSRKNHSIILQRLASLGQVTISERLGVHESSISRFKSKDSEELSRILAALDLKVVPVEMKCYPEETLAAILTMAKERMAQIENPKQLAWDD